MRYLVLVLALSLAGCEVGPLDADPSRGVAFLPTGSEIPAGGRVWIHNGTDEDVRCALETNAGVAVATVRSGGVWGGAILGPAKAEWVVVDCGDAGFVRYSVR